MMDMYKEQNLKKIFSQYRWVNFESSRRLLVYFVEPKSHNISSYKHSLVYGILYYRNTKLK